jgi:putative membrane protein
MQGILIRTAITMLGLFIASWLIPGVSIEGTGTFILAAFLLGIVNALVRPIAFLLTLPLTIITLGLFLFVLNAAMFGLVAAFLDNFVVSGFWAALFGAIVVSLTSTVASWTIGPDGRYEILVIRRH